MPLAASTAHIYVTNSAGTNVHVVDSATNKVLQVIGDIERPHGVQFAPDGSRVYISNEGESVINVVDRKTGKTIKKVSLSGHPNNIAVSKDGKRVFVCIADAPGGLDVIDTTTMERIKTVPVGRLHNVYVTPDGKYAVMGSTAERFLAVVDVQSEELAWKLPFDKAVRPMAFERNPDGSTRRVFIGLSDLNGFAVVDFEKRAEVTRIKHPDEPGGFPMIEAPSHAIGVAPDNRTLWSSSTPNNSIFVYSLPDLKLVGRVALPEVKLAANAPMARVGASPNWLTFTPDSKTVYVSNSGLKSVSVIDVKAMKLLTTVPVGEVPKRVNTLVLP
jgi:YVTN family beta-propeller protein